MPKSNQLAKPYICK